MTSYSRPWSRSRSLHWFVVCAVMMGSVAVMGAAGWTPAHGKPVDVQSPGTVVAGDEHSNEVIPTKVVDPDSQSESTLMPQTGNNGSFSDGPAG